MASTLSTSLRRSLYNISSRGKGGATANWSDLARGAGGAGLSVTSRQMSHYNDSANKGESGGKTFTEEDMKYVPDDLAASLKSAADDLAAEARAEKEADGMFGQAGGQQSGEGGAAASDGSSTRFRELIQKFAPRVSRNRGKTWTPLKPPTVDGLGRAYGLGRRKRSVARVWVSLSEGDGGVFFVNKRPMIDYFPRDHHQNEVLKPLEALKKIGNFHVRCQAKGGGTSGQAGAIRLGLARALENHEPWWRRPLKDAGLLTRDARKVERKKPGLKKARKAPQWVKR